MMVNEMQTIAIIDDESDIRGALRQMFELEGYGVADYSGGEDALAAIDNSFAGIVITDLRMPGMDGSALFNRLNMMDSALPVIIMSGHGDLATAVDLVKRGAYDYLSKPFDGDHLIASVRRALDKRALVLENRVLRAQPKAQKGHAILGESPAMVLLRDTISQLALADIDVLITGESGSGTSLAAASLDQRRPRARKPMITVDCAALPGEFAESILFGHVSGALPGAQFPRAGQLLRADGGCLLLDHVEGLTPELQRRMAQMLEAGCVLPVGGNQPHLSQFRTLCTSRADLNSLMENGDFDRSLYFRLNRFQLNVPPLRARGDDVMLLFRTFLLDESTALGREPPALSPAIWRKLKHHDWPGNVRELRSFASNVALGLGTADIPAAPLLTPLRQAGLKEAVAAFEADIIRSSLSANNGDVGTTIAALVLPRKTFYDKLARHRIDPNDYRMADTQRP